VADAPDLPDAGDALPDYVRGLLDPAAYPHEPESVELAQTHISYVFIADGFVYKTKKPVDFGFINQVAAETRERFCHAEVALNRRLAPDVYLDVVPVVRLPDGGYAVDVPRDRGEVVEWAVKMRRLPDDRTLAALLEAGAAPPDVIERIVGRLIAFHAETRAVDYDPAFAGGAGVRGWWGREFGEAERFIDGTWDARAAARLRAFADATVETEQPLFDARLAEGRVVEGHGDLHARHVYVLGPRREDLVIVDCIEFSEWFHFRYVDAGYDVAFLAMDLEARGHPELGDELAGRYIAAAADETMGVLQPLHRAFRAFVRGKVESIGATAPEVPAAERRRLADSAAAYFRLAAEYGERRAAPSLVVVAGLPGTGKSTVGGALAGRVGAAYLSSDAIRKRLAGIDIHEHRPAGFREGLYAPELTARTYGEMRRRAAAHLAAGRPVVLDATHARVADREAALAVARAAEVPALLVELRTTDADALARIESRQAALATSDATPEIYREARELYEPVVATEGRTLALDASQSVGALAREVAEALPRRA